MTEREKLDDIALDAAPADGTGGSSFPELPPLAVKMKRDILARRYKSGEWLRLTDLESRYDASRSEVRKALSVLATLRNLEHVENHGYRVVVFDAALDLAHRETRLVLEIANAERFIRDGKFEKLQPLREKAEYFHWSIENKSYGEVDLANHDFHREMAKLSGNPVTSRVIDDLREVILPSGRHPWATIKGFRTSAAEHFEMVDRLEDRDLPGFTAILRQHMFRWVETNSEE